MALLFWAWQLLCHTARALEKDSVKEEADAELDCELY